MTASLTEFSHWLHENFGWPAVVFATLLLTLIALSFYFQMKRGNGFDILDALKDPVSKKTSLDALIVVFFALLSAWYVMRETLNDQHPGSLLIQIITIFVIYRGAKQALDVWGQKPPPLPPPPQQGDNVAVKQVAGG